jgi:hypothetical protein
VRLIGEGAPIRINDVFAEERRELRITARVERGEGHEKISLTAKRSPLK